MNRPQDPEAVNGGTGAISESGSSPEGRRWIIPAGIIALVIAITVCWTPVLPGAFHLDDLPNLVKNKHLKTWVEKNRGLQKFVWDSPAKFRPLPYLTFALDAKGQTFKKLSAEPFVKTNIVLHILATIMAFTLLRAFFRLHAAGWSESLRDASALLGTALWALNPVQTAAVSYPVQRMAVMAALFSFICLWAWLRWRESGKWYFMPVVVAAFAAGLLSKEITATVPAVILVYEWAFRRETRMSILNWAVIALMVAGSVVLYSLYLNVSGAHRPMLTEQFHNRDFNSLERMLTQGRVLWHYVSLWTLPLLQRLHLEYTIETSRNLFAPVTTALSWAAWIAAAVWAGMNRRTRPWMFMVVAGFLAFSAVESSFLNLAVAFQHRLYLPSIILAGGVAAGAGYLIHTGRLQAMVATGIFALVLLGLCAVTTARNGEWSNSIKLLYADIQRTPAGPRSYYNLARKIRGKTADFSLKLTLLEKAYDLGYGIDACMEAASARTAGQPALTARGEALFARCEKDLEPTADLYLNWGIFYRFAGDEESARARYQKGLELEPDNPRLLGNMGSSFYRSGNLDEARRLLTRALEINPKNPSNNLNMAFVLYNVGDDAAADEHVKRAQKSGIRVSPKMVKQIALRKQPDPDGSTAAPAPEGAHSPDSSDGGSGDDDSPDGP